MRRCATALAALVLAWSVAGAPAAAGDEVLATELEEHVEVQLVLVDLVVLDRDDRTVPDLTRDDFELRVGGKLVELASLDRDCPIGAAPEPRAGAYRDADRRALAAPVAPPRQARKLVIVIDYFHVDNFIDTLRAVREAVATHRIGGEQIMVVSLADVLRIEQPFTAEIQAVQATLDRMEHDPELYFGPNARLTLFPFLTRIEALFNYLEQIDGRKLLVLYSALLKQDGFFHDPEYRRLAALATRARSAIYAVDTGGMRTAIDPADRGVLGPPQLRRLAHETGGRLTTNTNDLTLGYARAQRDYGCTYTLGFYDDAPRLDRSRRITVDTRDAGHRVVHPSYYVIRSREEERRSRIDAAEMLPEMFESEQLEVRLFALQPASARKWDTLVGFEVHLDAATVPVDPDGPAWEVRGALRKPNGVRLDSFRRRIDPVVDQRTLTVYERLRARPGRYKLSVIASRRGMNRPIARTVDVELPAIPQSEPFLVAPLLVREAAAAGDAPDLGTGDVEPRALIPLLAARAVQGEPVGFVSRACLVGARPLELDARLARRVRSGSGRAVADFTVAPVAFDEGGSARCRTLVDWLPTDALTPGAYTMTARTEPSAGRPVESQVAFELLPPVD